MKTKLTKASILHDLLHSKCQEKAKQMTYIVRIT
jgi:hypothetical protein